MAIEIASSCQGNDGCARMICSSGKSTATSSTSIGLQYLRRIPPPPGDAGADPAVAGVEERRHAGLRDRLVERIRDAVVREELLEARVELEAARRRLGDQAPRRARAGPARGGSMLAKGISMSAVGGGALSAISSFEIGGRPVRARVDREDHAAMRRAR